MPSMLTLSEACREAFIHDRHVIMGREMQPFCCDHIDLLEGLQSPMVIGGAIQIEHAQAAVKICSTRNNQEYFDASLRPDKYWQKWNKLTRGYPLAAFVKAWNNYFEDYSPKFEMFHKSDQDAPKIPYHVLSAARLVQHGHDPAKARRMGIGELTVWALAIMENNPTPVNPEPLKLIKDDWDVQTALEIAEMERN